jgi:hypothetical protein
VPRFREDGLAHALSFHDLANLNNKLFEQSDDLFYQSQIEFLLLWKFSMK